MAEASKIEWCDATFNPWWGCAEVSPGCGNCYARTWAAFTKAKLQLWPPKGAAGKGQEHAVMVTSDANWRKPLQWAKLAREGLLPDGTENVDGHRPRIFTASMADVFEPLADLEDPRVRLMMLIERTPELDWLVLTKRPEFARDWISRWYDAIERGNFPEGTRALRPYPNMWMGTSIENARFTWRADVLRELPAAVRFISAEPLLGSLYPPEAWCRACGHPTRGHRGVVGCDTEVSDYGDMDCGCQREFAQPLDLSGIDWVIIGGESGGGARPFHLEHAREIISAASTTCICYPGMCPQGCEPACPYCSTAEPHRPAVFVKQLGAKPVEERSGPGTDGGRLWLDDRKGGDIEEWPADLRIREFPRSAMIA